MPNCHFVFFTCNKNENNFAKADATFDHFNFNLNLFSSVIPPESFKNDCRALIRVTGIKSHTLSPTLLASYSCNPPSLYLPSPCIIIPREVTMGQVVKACSLRDHGPLCNCLRYQSLSLTHASLRTHSSSGLDRLVNRSLCSSSESACLRLREQINKRILASLYLLPFLSEQPTSVFLFFNE